MKLKIVRLIKIINKINNNKLFLKIEFKFYNNNLKAKFKKYKQQFKTNLNSLHKDSKAHNSITKLQK